MNICFGDLVKVNGWWEVAFKSDGKVVVVITPPYPMMDGSGFPGFRAVGISRVETHYSIAAVPGAIEALIEIAAGKTTMVDGATVYMVMFEAQEIAETALRAVRGEESA